MILPLSGLMLVALLGTHAHAARERADAPARSEAAATPSRLETLEERARNASLGFSITSLAGDYAFGADLDSPAFLDRRVRARLSASYAWLPGIPRGAFEEIWSSYALYRLGFTGGGFVQGTAIRGYGGGGVALVIPSADLSEATEQFGGFGLVGLEFFLGERNFPMFVELGGISTGAKAERFDRSPIYANGFMAAWGLRAFL